MPGQPVKRLRAESGACRTIREWQLGVGLFAVGNILNFVSLGVQTFLRVTHSSSSAWVNLSADIGICCRVCSTVSAGSIGINSVCFQCRFCLVCFERKGNPQVLNCYGFGPHCQLSTLWWNQVKQHGCWHALTVTMCRLLERCWQQRPALLADVFYSSFMAITYRIP